MEDREEGDYVIASYREIAVRFGLGGPNAARTKVKRAGWPSEPVNHPADPLRIRVPRTTWDLANETHMHALQGRGGTKRREIPHIDRNERQDINELRASLDLLREQLERERNRADKADELARTVAELQERMAAQGVELMEAREQVARLDGEMAGLRVALTAAESQVATERKDAVEARAALDRLRGRGLLARLLNRKQ
jgi:hypothetical protein